MIVLILLHVRVRLAERALRRAYADEASTSLAADKAIEQTALDAQDAREYREKTRQAATMKLLIARADLRRAKACKPLARVLFRAGQPAASLPE